MKVALVQESSIVGDVSGNVQRLLSAMQRAKDQGAELAVSCELAISAYPSRDYLERDAFIDRQRAGLDALAASAPLPALIGFVDRKDEGGQTRLYNAAAYIANGKVVDVIHKSLLPSYDVFDEARYFSPANERRLIDIAGVRVGVSICEDIWNDAEHGAVRRYDCDPIEELAAQGAELLINLSASPFAAGKRQMRQRMLCAQARKHGLPLLVVNHIGGHDDLLFDGGSMAIDGSGIVRGQCRDFASDLLVVEVDRGTKSITASRRPVHGFDAAGETGAGLDALVMGVRDYAHKCGFRSALLGLSGGIDSALCAAIAAMALGPDKVYAVALPSKYSSEHSLRDANDLALAMGIHYQVISIESTVSALETSLAESFAGTPADVTEENLQARSRGIVLMALSNKFGHLVLNTGNKSEIAVGYCTLYGDMCGGLSVISDVYKGEVYRMSREVNRRAGAMWIPESTLIKAPSAELRPGQLDQDSLPPYDLLDTLLERFLEAGESAESLRRDFDPALVNKVLAMIKRAEYKRYQMPPGLKIRIKSFGPGRRMPLACGPLEE